MNIMNKIIIAILSISVLSISAQAGITGDMDMYAGHFSREGNNQSPSETTNNNIYIKIYENQWVGLLYVPYPYARTVSAPAITKVFENAKKKTAGSAYLRGTFGQLAENATIQIEKFGYLEDRLVFECGSLSPCTIKLHEDFLELIKPGIINEHIIKYNHVLE
jgi:hypothetical protein